MASIRKRKTAHGHNCEVDYVDGSGVVDDAGLEPATPGM